MTRHGEYLAAAEEATTLAEYELPSSTYRAVFTATAELLDTFARQAKDATPDPDDGTEHIPGVTPSLLAAADELAHALLNGGKR